MAFNRNRSIPQVVGRSQRRKTLWLGGTYQGTVVTASGGTLLTSLNAGALALRPFTIVRTRGLVFIRSDQAAAAEDQVGAYAVATASEQAVAAGVTSLPTPVTDDGSELFFVYQPLMASFESGTGTNKGWPYVIDSKAMRKVNDGEDVYSVIELSATGSGFLVLTYFRMLIKLH